MTSYSSCAFHVSTGGHGHDELRQDVQRAGNGDHLADVLLTNAACGHRGIDDVLAVQGKDHSLAGLTDAMARPAQALNRGGDREGGRYEDDAVQRADIDAQLQGAGCHEGGQLAALQPLLHQEAHLARERAVMRPREGCRLALVDESRELLRVPAAVHEEEGRAVARDDLPAFPGQRIEDRLIAGAGPATGAGNEMRISYSLVMGQCTIWTLRLRYTRLPRHGPYPCSRSRHRTPPPSPPRPRAVSRWPRALSSGTPLPGARDGQRP